ncbi:hypothetical protein PVIIG_05790 [Plasmodium vivax India VII]|uniref:PIR Superfamily Protein n=1 Tax=Plasmodium vivax India VII TaxID=1077284 RepID=A0A0J9UT59_PLAVI|nr:hypothetical protein PVIIG_05790 [Plasmodium vivax India VII]
MSVRHILSQVKILISQEYFNNYGEFCEYLSYWIHSYIKSNDTCDNVNELYEQINLFKKLYIPEDNICNIENFKNIKEDFNKKKELFLHSENFYWIERTNDLTKNFDNISFDNYLKECSTIYNSVVKQDFCKSKTAYKTDLIKFHNNFNAARKFLKTNAIDISTDELTAPDDYKCTSDDQGHGERGDNSLGVVLHTEAARAADSIHYCQHYFTIISSIFIYFSLI